jgi:hypothetical protein
VCMSVRLGRRSSPGSAAISRLLRTGTGKVVRPVRTAAVARGERGVSRAPAVIAGRRVCRIARLVWDDVPRDATRRLVSRTKRQRDAYARGRCLGACRAPAHCAAHLVVGRRRYRRLCGDADGVRVGSGPLDAPAHRTFLTLAAAETANLAAHGPLRLPRPPTPATPPPLKLPPFRSWGGLTGLLWGRAVRVFLLHHVTFSINLLCHYFGRRPLATGDQWRNLAWLAPLAFGEAWHKNHHAFPPRLGTDLDGGSLIPAAG